MIITDKKLAKIKDKYFIKLLLLGIANLLILIDISNENSTCIFYTSRRTTRKS